MASIKALTLWQPYASLVARLAKKVETRSWATSYRGPLAIHAAVRECRREEITEAMARALDWHFPSLWADVDGLPYGRVVATCRLVTCYRLTSVESDAIRDGVTTVLRTLQAGPVEITPDEAAFGDYSPGRFAWVLADVQALTPPVLAKGGRGLWDWKRAA